MGGTATSLQQQILETLQDARCELGEDDYLAFLDWLQQRAKEGIIDRD